MIRPMRVSDLDRIKEIDRVAFSAEEQYGDAVYERMPQCGQSVVAETPDGEVVGYAFVGAEKHDSNGDAFGYVRSVAVHPDYRRRGYGRALLEAVIERGEHEIDLFVDERNEAAIGLYQCLGFQLGEVSPTAPQRRRMVLELP
jgi:ribosomal protein S18 acetylase RimI-like enzyme